MSQPVLRSGGMSRRGVTLLIGMRNKFNRKIIACKHSNIIRIHRLNQKSVKNQIKNVLRNSFKAPIASYKLDGAKLLVNRLQVQIK